MTLFNRSALRLAALLAAAVFGQAAAPDPAWVDPDKTEPAGTHYRTFTSKLAGGEVSYLIYLPPDYATNPERRYPVVYWLHGLAGTQRSAARFVSHLDVAIRTGRGPSMIVVMVNGIRDAFYCDSPDGRWPIESVIMKELIPHVDNTYRTIVARGSRAVEGYSMGGFGAAHLAFKYPEIFGIAGVMAGAMPDKEMIAKRPDIGVKMFGGNVEALMAEHPFTLLEKNQAAIRGRTAIRVAVGDQDSLQLQNQALHEMLDRLKIPHEYEVVPGVAHNMPLFYDLLGERPFGFYNSAFGAADWRRPPKQ
jgi:endo-1,4-beta-xylanase